MRFNASACSRSAFASSRSMARAPPLLAFRAALFDGFPLPTWEWAYSGACTLIVLLLGVWAFRRTEASLADRL